MRTSRRIVLLVMPFALASCAAPGEAPPPAPATIADAAAFVAPGWAPAGPAAPLGESWITSPPPMRAANAPAQPAPAQAAVPAEASPSSAAASGAAPPSAAGRAPAPAYPPRIVVAPRRVYAPVLRAPVARAPAVAPPRGGPAPAPAPRPRAVRARHPG